MKQSGKPAEKHIRPLNRSVTMACVLFVVLLSAVLSAATYRIYTSSMYERYQRELASVVTYVEGHVDKDDMSECARTFEESEKFVACQAFFDDFIDRYEDIHYLYICSADIESDPIRVVAICSANSTYEKEFVPENVIGLGEWGEDWYPEETIRRFHEIQMGDEDVYFVNPSEWGMDYSLVRPLIDSQGRHFATLCADIAIEEINRTVYRNIAINIAVILIPGILFILLLLLWMQHNVTLPLRQLEQSVAEFAGKSTGRRDPDELLFTVPEIRAQNEVRSLANAVTKLSVDMRDYVKGMIDAEKETRDLQEHVSQMNAIAYQDALTKVKNKAAYDKAALALQADIVNHAAEFGIVMTDLNHLKRVNDAYGHEHGNEYIVGACRMVCEVFKHSSIYRVGGDEFVVVLQGRDYRRREQLCAALRELFSQSALDEDAEPWHRYSAAVGMSAYEEGDDVEAVFRRADQAMYEAKTAMKAARE